MNKPVLYYAPPSFYSQVAKLALVEAGIEFDQRIIIPGPPTFGTYQPEYIKMNPQGTVPTLTNDGLIYGDSREIVDFLMDEVSKESPTPQKVKQSEVTRWVERAYGLSERELAYGNGGLMQFVGKHVNEKRLKVLVELKAKNPDLAEIYAAKILDIEDFIAKSQNGQHVSGVALKFKEALDQLDELLGKRAFVAGNQYSMADVCWTITVARNKMLKSANFDRRTNLARWFYDMQGRPSYQKAGVMEKFRISAMWEMVSSAWKKS